MQRSILLMIGCFLYISPVCGLLSHSFSTIFASYLLGPYDRRHLETSFPRTLGRIDRGEPLTINDIIKLTQVGVEIPIIVHYLEKTQAPYHLSKTQIRRMQHAGVSPTVIDSMIELGRKFPH